MAIRWASDLNTGIDVIDKQHMALVDYINNLENANLQKNKDAIKKVLDDLVEYTLSHFAFEENLQERSRLHILQTAQEGARTIRQTHK